MKQKSTGLLALLTLAATVTAGVWAQAADPATVTDIPAKALPLVSEKIKDMSATMVVKEVNRDELGKMGGSFGAGVQYSVKRMNITYQYPNKARFEGKILGATVLLVYNGDIKKFHTPIKSDTRNVHGQPGQKQTLMDLGIFAKDYLTTDYLPTFVKTDGKLQVFKLSQRNTTNTSHEIVWVNPKTSIIEKRLSYNGDNILQKELHFVNPVQVRPGIFVPTRVEIYNKEGKLGAAQGIEDIKVNLGVDDKQFETS